VSKPSLLWAVTHQTLAKSDVPCFEAAGFEVVAEDPELSVIRDSDVFEYPIVGEQGAEWDAFRGMRLWARNGLVSDAEVVAVNSAFDAIMVHSRLDVARNVRSWFDGAVLFRHFGEMPWVDGDPDTMEIAGDYAGITYVPLLPSLVGTPLSGAFDNTCLLRSTLAATGDCEGIEPTSTSSPSRLGLFVEKIDNPRKIRAWVSQLVLDLPGVEIVVMGLEPQFRSEIAELHENVVTPARLESAEYWKLFKSLSALVYPHSNPRHIHYVPYEAIALGIPCLASVQSPIGIDLRARVGNVEDRHVGLFQSPDDLIRRVPLIFLDRVALDSISKLQSAVLELISESAVVGQARAIHDCVMAGPEFAHRGAVAAADVFRPEIGMPRFDFGLVEVPIFEGKALTFQPAAVVTAETLGHGVHGIFHPAADHRGEMQVDLFPGESHFIRLPMPAVLDNVESFLRITVSVDRSHTFPAELTTINGKASSWAPFVRTDGASSSSASTWCALACMGDRQTLRIKVFGDQFHEPIHLKGIQVEVVDEGGWWRERDRHLVEVLEGIQIDYQKLSKHAAALATECLEVKQAAEAAGEWGAELERQIIDLNKKTPRRLVHRIRGLTR
jgi:hypothetical protein